MLKLPMVSLLELLPSLAFFLLVYGLVEYIKSYAFRVSLKKIPAASYDGPLTSYISAFQYLRDARKVLQAGYKKTKNGLFRVPQPDRWLIIATGTLVDELRSAPDSNLSLEAAMVDILQSDFTLGVDIRQSPYHLPVIRSLIGDKLVLMLSPLLDEVSECFTDMIDSQLIQEDTQAGITASDLSTKLISRVNNRLFVGKPLCRSEDYSNINIGFAHHVMFGAAFLSVFPQWLKPTVSRLYNFASRVQTRIQKHLQPVIEERLQMDASGQQKPDDVLSWLMDAATSEQKSIEGLCRRMLNVNFFALHTTAMTFTHALFHIASRTEYLNILRTELGEILGTDQWSIEKLDACWKLDSFLKESQRLNGLGALSLPRKAVKAHQFSNGCTVPIGSIVSASPTSTHLDPSLYQDPDTFDGLRFFELRRQALSQHGLNSAAEMRCRSTSPSPAYLAYGGGRHACPGRFLATLIIKVVFAQLILKYDIGLAIPKRPQDVWFGPVCIPSPSAKVTLRTRRK